MTVLCDLRHQKARQLPTDDHVGTLVDGRQGAVAVLHEFGDQADLVSGAFLKQPQGQQGDQGPVVGTVRSFPLVRAQDDQPVVRTDVEPEKRLGP